MYAFQERTAFFRRKAEALLSEQEAPSPSKFVRFEKLGSMFWRSREKFSEEQCKQLLVLLKERAVESGDSDIEHLRQLLDDTS